MKIENVNHQGRVLDFYISFRHDMGKRDENGNIDVQSFGLTHCTVTATPHGQPRENGDIMGDGWATKVPGDQYCKETGRKYALTRALSKLDRTVRSRIWQEYWATKKQQAVA